jgi:hypothetical protein
VIVIVAVRRPGQVAVRRLGQAAAARYCLLNVYPMLSLSRYHRHFWRFLLPETLEEHRVVRLLEENEAFAQNEPRIDVMGIDVLFPRIDYPNPLSLGRWSQQKMNFDELIGEGLMAVVAVVVPVAVAAAVVVASFSV